MKITSENQKPILILRFDGRFDTQTAAQGQSTIEGEIARGWKYLVLDFSHLDFISSAGLRILLKTSKTLKAAGGELRVHGPNETVREIFQISGFDSIFKVFESRDEAMAGFPPA